MKPEPVWEFSMSHWHCCCESGCLIVEDDFNRPNNTYLGSNWVETGGDPYISGNALYLPVSGEVTTTWPHPNSSETAWVEVTLKDIYYDKTYQVLVNTTNSGTGGHLIQYNISNEVGDTSWLSVGGDTLEIGSIDPFISGDLNLTVCRNNTGIYANLIEFSSATAWDCVDSAGGYYVTLKNGGSGTIVMDDFLFSKHHATLSECPACFCDCSDYCFSKTLTLTMDGDLACENCYDGVEISLEYNTDYRGNPFRWEGSGYLAHYNCSGDATETLGLFRFDCPSMQLCFDHDDWRDIQEGGWGSCGGAWIGNTPESTSCSPIYITYPSGSMSDSSGPESLCYLKLIITE
jgi:hypothetical protein